MKKVLFLSSALIMTVCGAFAEDVATPDKKITGGAGTCTVDVLGVSDNNATANTIATWSLNSYECAAGQYLDETTLLCTECPVGSYCPGGTFTVEANNSKTACPTDYTSDAAATAESECYMGCELTCSANAECPPHSNNCTHSEFKTTGKQYVDATCNAYPSICPVADFQCDTGYSKITLTTTELMAFQQLGVDSWLVCNTLNEDETDGKHGIGDTLFPDNFVNDCDILEPGQVAFVTELGSLVYQMVVNDYNPSELPGLKIVSYPECDGCITMVTNEYLENANFQSGLFGDNSWVSLKYIALPDVARQELLYSAADEFLSSGSLSSATMTALQNNFSVESLMLLQNLIQNADNLDTEQLNNIFYAISFSAMNKVETNLPWVSSGKINTDTDEVVLSNLAFSIAMLIGLDAFKWDAIVPDWTLSYCANNTINIDWNPDNNGEHIKNMCTYDGAITLPSDPVKPGYTFTGWKLVESTTTE